MIARSPVYLFVGMAVFAVVLAVLGLFHGKGQFDTAHVVPTIAKSVLLPSGASPPSHVVVNEYGWYTDGASHTGPDYDSREH